MVKFCELDEKKFCDNCMDCELCDLIADKTCDNCGNCIDAEDGFKTVKIDEFIKGQEQKEQALRIAKTKLSKN